MDVNDLRYFETVARHGSMNRAARELNTVQSNVTARIRGLEHEFGTTLFHRYPRGVTLTPAGDRLLPYARQLIRLISDARASVSDDGSPRGRLAVGSLETTAAVRMFPLLSRFAKSCPEVRLSLTTGSTASLIADVLDFKLDAAFVAGPVDHPSLACEAVFEEELVLLTPSREITLRSLGAVEDVKTVVFRNGCSYRSRLDRLLAEQGVVDVTCLEFGSIEAIVSLVAAGVGVSLLPRSVVSQCRQRDQVAVHELPDEHARVQTLFVRQREAYVNAALAAFISTLRAEKKTRGSAATGRMDTVSA